MGVEWKKYVFDCKKLCSRDMAKTIVQWYIHTGADTVSAFYGHGKKSVMTNIAKITDFSLSLDKVGMQLPITDSVVDQLRNCTIKSVYNDNKSKTLADARASKWKIMKKKSFSRLPPDEDSHYQHPRRVNYQSYVYLDYMNKDALPSPKDQGWSIQEGKCYPIRYTESALPSNVCEILKKREIVEAEIVNNDPAENDEEVENFAEIDLEDGESNDEDDDDDYEY